MARGVSHVSETSGSGARVHRVRYVWSDQVTDSPRFDVASVKIIDARPTNGDRPPPSTRMPSRIDYHLIQMKNLVLRAWPVESYQVIWPAWVVNQYAAYDVSATMPSDTTKEQFQFMLRGMLADRFKLAAHREIRDTKVYALGVSTRGLKLRSAVNPPANENSMSYGVTAGQGNWKWQSRNTNTPEAPSGVTVARFVFAIGAMADRPLLDTTGLTGYYDIDLNIPLDLVPEGAATDRIGGASSTQPSQSQLFDALEKQLGFKVEGKTLPIEMLVIDRLERVPTEN